MNKRFFLATALGAVMMTACSHEYEMLDKQLDASGESVAAKFTSSINGATPQTRATGSTWVSSDSIGIFMVDATPTAVDGMINKHYKKTSGDEKNFSPATTNDAIYYPVDGSTVNFISYYPYQASTLLGNYNVNVVNQNTPAAIDFLYAKTITGYSKTSGQTPVHLTFIHKLTLLVMDTKAGYGLTDDDLKGMVVTIKGLNTQTTIDLKDGSQGNASSKNPIVTKVNTDGKEYSAILIPQDVTAGDVTVEFEITSSNGVETFVWKVPTVTFETQKRHTYSVTISRTGIEVEGEITDWLDVQGGDVNAD
jgi:hypothetical protein